MKPQKKIRVILKEQAKNEYDGLSRIVEEQAKKGKTNSEEMQLLKSINKNTLRTNEVEIVSFVLYIIDHPTYDKIFCYKGK